MEIMLKNIPFFDHFFDPYETFISVLIDFYIFKLFFKRKIYSQVGDGDSYKRNPVGGLDLMLAGIRMR